MPADQTTDQIVDAPDAEIEARARQMGWHPKSEFNGDDSKWVDAAEFVRRGEEVLPILRHTNRRLEEQLRTQNAELDKMRGLIAAGQESIAALQEHQAEALQRATEKARRELLAELKAAKRDGDVDREVEITDALDKVRTQESEIAAVREGLKRAPAPAPASKPEQDTPPPELAAWMADNPWFGNDQRKTQRALGIAQELRSYPEYDTLAPREFYDKVVEVMEQRSGTRSAASKVGNGRPAHAAPASDAPTYDNLPAEAKAACDQQAKKLVGPGRAFKDVAAWRAQYAQTFFATK